MQDESTEETELKRVPLYTYHKERKVLIGEALINEADLHKQAKTGEPGHILTEVTAAKFTFEVPA